PGAGQAGRAGGALSPQHRVAQGELVMPKTEQSFKTDECWAVLHRVVVRLEENPETFYRLGFDDPAGLMAARVNHTGWACGLAPSAEAVFRFRGTGPSPLDGYYSGELAVAAPDGGEATVWEVYHPARRRKGKLRDDWPNGLDTAGRDAKAYKRMVRNLKAWVAARAAQLRAADREPSA